MLQENSAEKLPDFILIFPKKAGQKNLEAVEKEKKERHEDVACMNGKDNSIGCFFVNLFV